MEQQRPYRVFKQPQMPTAETQAEDLLISAAYVCTPGSTLTPWTPAADPLAGMSQCWRRFQSGCARWLGPAGCAWPPSAQTAAGLTGLASVQTSALSFCQAYLVLVLTAPLAQLSRPGHVWVCVLLPSSGLHPPCPTLLPGVKPLLGSPALLRTYSGQRHVSSPCPQLRQALWLLQHPLRTCLTDGGLL